jgi:hypothetical protein
MQTCGSAAPSPVWHGLNVGFQPRGMCGSHLQRMSGLRHSCRYVRNAAFTTNALADRRHFRAMH